MPLENTEAEKKPTIRHMVTYKLIKNSFADPERTTECIYGDLADFHARMELDPSVKKCIIEFAILLWD